MNTRIKPIVIFLLCACGAGPFNTAAAQSNCNEFRNDINSLQAAVRQADVEVSDRGLSRIADASRQMKKMCMDNVVSMDVSAFGFGSMGTQAVMQAAAKVCDQVASRVNTAGQSASNSVSSKTADYSKYTNALSQATSAATSTSSNSSDSSTGKSITDIWSRLRQLVQ